MNQAPASAADAVQLRSYDTQLWLVDAADANTAATPAPCAHPTPLTSPAPALADIFARMQHTAAATTPSAQLAPACAALQAGEAVAFATETVWGLGADAFKSDAIAKIYAAKGRPSDNPLIVHVATAAQLESCVSRVPPAARRLIEAFWPGPLSIILPHTSKLSPKVTAGLDTVAVRMPAHTLALRLIGQSGCCLAAPSANTSGRPSPTTHSHVIEDLKGRIAGVVAGAGAGVGDCEFGVESTVVDLSHLPEDTDVDTSTTTSTTTTSTSAEEGLPPLAFVLRPGAVTVSMLESVLGAGRVTLDPTLLIDAEAVCDDTSTSTSTSSGGLAPRSPGMKYQHYAPKAPLFLVLGGADALAARASAALAEGLRVGVLTSQEGEEAVRASTTTTTSNDRLVVRVCGSRARLLTVAAKLYDTLRLFDDDGVDVIFSETFSRDEMGAAVMNRLLKSSGGKVLRG